MGPLMLLCVGGYVPVNYSDYLKYAVANMLGKYLPGQSVFSLHLNVQN